MVLCVIATDLGRLTWLFQGLEGRGAENAGYSNCARETLRIGTFD